MCSRAGCASGAAQAGISSTWVVRTTTHDVQATASTLSRLALPLAVTRRLGGSDVDLKGLQGGVPLWTDELLEPSIQLKKLPVLVGRRSLNVNLSVKSERRQCHGARSYFFLSRHADVAHESGHDRLSLLLVEAGLTQLCVSGRLWFGHHAAPWWWGRVEKLKHGLCIDRSLRWEICVGDPFIVINDVMAFRVVLFGALGVLGWSNAPGGKSLRVVVRCRCSVCMCEDRRIVVELLSKVCVSCVMIPTKIISPTSQTFRLYRTAVCQACDHKAGFFFRAGCCGFRVSLQASMSQCTPWRTCRFTGDHICCVHSWPRCNPVSRTYATTFSANARWAL